MLFPHIDIDFVFVLDTRWAGNLSGGHQVTRKILKRKKRTDSQYVNKARFDGQRFGKLKVATWNVRGFASIHARQIRIQHVQKVKTTK